MKRTLQKQAVKSVTYVAARNNPPIIASSAANNAVTTSSFQPVKLTTTGFAITPTGKSGYLISIPQQAGVVTQTRQTIKVNFRLPDS